MIYYPEIKYIRLAEKEKNADERQNQQIIRMAESKPRRQDNDSFAGSSYYYDVRPGLGRISPVRAAGLEVVLLRCLHYLDNRRLLVLARSHMKKRFCSD